MKLTIEGHHLPGRTCGQYTDVHVGLQVRKGPVDVVPADSTTATWSTDIEVIDGDFRGPAVQGRRGERFVYLTWGEGSGEAFTMFRRAKLMLAEVPDPSAARVTARVHLTDDCGAPRCARLKPPAVQWS